MPDPTQSAPDVLDVLIVGAGLSGIGAAVHLQQRCPSRRFAIVEARDAIGGTWDLFRYPGIRSDSDMHTLGYRFAPWTDAKAIADGPAILAYIRDTARRYGVDDKIRFGHKVVGARFDSSEAHWTLDIETAAGTTRLAARFVYMCSGYYDAAQGYTPELPHIDRFGGTIVHPQHWPEDLQVAGKRVVVIGSGATAVTLVPALAHQGAEVTMLQRTPSYMISRPARDAVANALRRWLPERAAYGAIRFKNVVLAQLFYELCRRAPARMRRLLLQGVRRHLEPKIDVDTHFSPPYAPWDQRMCLVPDGDLFAVLADGRAKIVTDHIESLTADGVALRSGDRLPADIIVTATGLRLQIVGGATVVVDGKTIVPHEHMTYKAMMLSDVPNMALCFGYTNASWTLKADLTSEYVCRLLNAMEARGHKICVPRPRDPSVTAEPFIALRSGYVARAEAWLPHAGSKPPWRSGKSYLRDRPALRWGALDDGVMEFC